MGAIVGIDLGTTNSAIGILDGERVRLFPNPLGDVLTPSAVAVDPKTRMLVVGRTAKDLLALMPQQGAARFKTDMGSDRRYRLGDRELGAVELSALVLDAMRADAERELGQRVDRCVVSVPAYFDDAQRHATRQAAEQAGFGVERIINEPTAAAIAFGMHHRDHETLFAVVDLGGGTFDVCVMELFEGVLQVKSVAGESRLGGEDFTEQLARHLAMRADLGYPEPGTPRWSLLYKRAELAKRTLARWPTAEVVLGAEITGKTASTVLVSAEDADRVWEPLILRLHAPLRAALRGAGVAPSDLAEVILVGGATRMPLVRRVVREIFERDPIHHGDPDLLVAEGAAIQASMIAGASAVEDMVVTDVASHSLGISTSKVVGSHRVDGYFAPIIHRNTVIPTSQVEGFQTLDDDQRTVTLQIYEGDQRKVEDNRKIGELVVEGIPKGRAPKSFKVRMTCDQNGMLEVESTIDETKARITAIFRRAGGELSATQLERARARLRAARADPMDRPRYRDVYARAKLLWADLDPAGRERLDVVLERFEAAMILPETKQHESTYRELLAVCESIDHGERW